MSSKKSTSKSSSKNKTKRKKKEASKTDKPVPTPQERKAHWKSIGLAVLSGCLWFLACADFDIWPLAYIAMFPAFWAVENAPTRKKALFYGWIAGVVANAGGFYWITSLLQRFGHMPLPVASLGLLMLAAYQAVVFWLFFMVLRSIRIASKERTGRALPMVLLAPIIMVSFELLVPFLFPWYLAITQAWVIPVIQIAEFTGPLGISAFLMLVNGAVYDLYQANPRQKKISAGVALAVASIVLSFGYLRISQVDAQRSEAPALKVGVVQGNIPFDEKGIRRKELAAQQLHDLQKMSEKLEEQGAEFLMWTESSYPYPIARKQAGDFGPKFVARIRKGFTVPLMLGALTYDSENLSKRPYNSALMLDSDGSFTARFDKIFLLMFGEYIPFLETFPILEDILPKNASHFSRGEDIVIFPFQHKGETYRLGPMICYEDILPDFGRKLAESHPHLLVNITNDSWFGDTSEPWEHMALSVYRAVEMRTDMIRAVNTGVSAFIDAKGKVFAKTYALDPKITPKPVDGLLGEVRLMEGGHTFYARFGNLFGYLCVLASLFFLLLWPRMQKSQPLPQKTKASDSNS